MQRWRAETIQVGLSLGVLSITGSWKPNDVERKAAWELYVELATRVTVVPLEPSTGLLRDALSSFYSLFGTTREILRSHGPALALPQTTDGHSFGELAVLVLNYELRPLLAGWHPLLEQWEATRPSDVARVKHEDAWEHAPALRDALEQTRVRLMRYADLLAAAAGVPPLTLPERIPEDQEP